MHAKAGVSVAVTGIKPEKGETMNLRIGRPASLVVGLLAVAGMLAPAADAAPKKFYKLNVPAKGLPGSTQEFKVSLENRSESQSLGSANIKVPFNANEVIQLRNLNLAPGATHAFTVKTVTPEINTCDSKTYAWTADVKQANDFNGTGNDFAPLPGSSSNTTLNCNDGLNKPAGADCETNKPCSVNITYHASPSVELSATALAGPVAGRLTAEWLPNSDTTGPAGPMSCPTQVHASPVIALVDFKTGTPLSDATQGRDKVLTLTRSPDVVKNLQTTDELDVCGAVPAESSWVFKAPGTPFFYKGHPWVSGLLADCSQLLPPFQPGIPCVSGRHQDDAGNYVVEFAIPRLPGDPMYK